MRIRKLFIFGILLLFLSIYSIATVNAQAKELEISVSSSKATVNAGSFKDITVTITNNQDNEDKVEIFTAGSFPYQERLSKKRLTIPAKTSEQLVLRLSCQRRAQAGTFEQTVTVLSENDAERWVSSTIHVDVSGWSKGGKMGQFHSQPPLSASPDHLSTEGIGPGKIGLNFYFNPKLVDRGYVLKDGDQCCVGDTLTVEKSSLTGEWFKKGGPRDTPPVQWANHQDSALASEADNDFEIIKSQIDEGTFHTDTDEAYICSWRRIQDADTGPNRCVVDAALICSHFCEFSSSGNIQETSTEKFEVANEGNIEIGINCPIECIFFVDRQNRSYGASRYKGRLKTQLTQAYGLMTLDSQIPTLSSLMTVNAVKGTRGPDLRIQKVFCPPKVIENEPLYIKLELENTGDAEAKLDKLKLNAPAKILYSPGTLAAGETSEIILEAEIKEVTDLKLDLEYRSDTLGCLPTKDFKGTFDLGKIEVVETVNCNTGSDCPAEDFGLEKMVCCNGLCRDPLKGICDDLDGDGTFEWAYY